MPHGIRFILSFKQSLVFTSNLNLLILIPIIVLTLQIYDCLRTQQYKTATFYTMRHYF